MIRVLIAGLTLLAAHSGALACDCMRFVPGPHLEEDVDRVVAGSSAIIDGVIERPMSDDGRPAMVRPTHIWKGPKLGRFKVGLVSDCSTLVDAKLAGRNRPVRLILFGGPEIFEASRCTNFQGAAFDEAVDRRLRSLSRRVREKPAAERPESPEAQWRCSTGG